MIGESHPQTSLIFNGIAKEQGAELVFADLLFDTGHPLQSIDGCQIFNIRKGMEMVYQNIRLDLLGKYQSKNICTVLAAVDGLKRKGWNIPEHAIRSGLEKVVENTGLAGRWQVLGANPRIICDTGHNVAGIREVVAQIKLVPHKTLHFVIGMVNDKDIMGVLAILPRDAIYYFTKASIPRALDETKLMKLAAHFKLHGSAYHSVKDAIAKAKQNSLPEDLIFIGGSTFVVAEAI